MLDGYLTAIVIGPQPIPPDEWFVDLLGERGRIATAFGKMLTAITPLSDVSTPSVKVWRPLPRSTRQSSIRRTMARCYRWDCPAFVDTLKL
jgi:hypothetical protein